MLLMLLDIVDDPEDKKKVEALYHKYDRLMYHIAGNILKRQEDIEDAVMEAWVRIIRNLDKISEISCPKTKSYLVIVVERTSIDIYNKGRKFSESEVSIADYEQSPFFVTHDQQIKNAEIYEDLRRLPKEYGEVLILYYMQEMEIKEIATALNVSESNVYKRIQRGRNELEKRWGR